LPQESYVGTFALSGGGLGGDVTGTSVRIAPSVLVLHLMSRGVNLCHVAQLDYCIALGAVRSGASSGVRPGLAVRTTSRFLLGALQGFRWISSRIP
jgi:hypothetical protein